MSTKQVFFGNWSDLNGLRDAFASYNEESPVPADLDVIFASYDGGGYDGDASVVFRRDGKLYEVHGSHCSCYGLEDQWDPEEATVESLKVTIIGHLGYSHGDDAKLAWGAIITALEAESVQR
jgi:hypothetical protein